MAITGIEYAALLHLREKGLLPARPDILELGRQNWYGDVSFKAVSMLAGEILGGDADALARFETEFDAAVERAETGDIAPAMREIALLFYRLVFDFRSLTAIDFDDAPGVLRYDLNRPVPLDRRFAVITNIGTAEHVFNVHQVFQTIHELTEPGGLMIHTAPLNGWWDHGFYAFHPTLYFDLAEANGYDVALLTYGTVKPFRAVHIGSREEFLRFAGAGEIARHAVLNCALRKSGGERPFEAPIQGVYAGTLSDEAMAAWRKLR